MDKKELRYLYARFYFWCMVPAVQDTMEGCPPSNLNLLYLILSALIGLFIFLVVIAVLKIKKGQQKAVMEKSRRASMMDAEFQQLQKELYGDKLRSMKHASFAASESQGGPSAVEMPASSNAASEHAACGVEPEGPHEEVELEC